MEQFFVHEDEEIWNDALEMALEWGENFGKPIGERLMHKHPQLSRAQADDFEAKVSEAKYFAFGQFERAYIKEISWPQAYAAIRDRFPLINQANLDRLSSQGQYYAWRDHG